MGKRVFDLVVGAVMALVALPLILGFAIALAISLRAWPFFLQERIGQHGRPFKMLKLRTLPPNTPAYASKHVLDLNGLSGLCRFLRETHLDELPQLICVVFGQLSLVGPRPKMPDAVEPINGDFGRARVAVPQGCTGVWQIGEHSHLEVSAVEDYDRFYLANQSLRLDVWILWQTALVLSRLRRGASLDSIPQWAVASSAAVRKLEPPASALAFENNARLARVEAA